MSNASGHNEDDDVVGVGGLRRQLTDERAGPMMTSQASGGGKDRKGPRILQEKWEQV